VTEGQDSLIKELAGDLRPVKGPGRVGAPAAQWLLAAGLYSIGVVFVTGPLRPGAMADLAAHATYGAETLLAVLVIVALTAAALRSAIPGAYRPARWLLPLLPLAAWASVYALELRYPPAYYSSLGGRYECFWQVVLFSVPALALMIWYARRQFPLRPRLTGFFAGAAAAAIPGELMQFGCMYVPSHILTHHLAPIAVTAVLGAVIGPWFLKQRSPVRRPPETPLH